ncbi:MAG: WD40/YVTN/BNR-like repeat-containing protein [Actinomycetota bacterium]
MSKIRLKVAAIVAVAAVCTLTVTSAPAVQQRSVLSFHPESPREFDEARMGYGPHTPQEAELLAKALQREASMVPSSSIRGASGKWSPYGSGPQHGDDPNYAISAEGINTMAGRIDSFAYDAQHNRVFATMGTGGVFMTSDLGQSWHSIGDNLPTQVNGAIGYSKADHGTLIDLSGEPIMAYGARVGLGAYRSTNLGKTWEKVRGIPDGALGFQVAVDPNHDKIIYAATSKGLFRSGDDGISFANVRLPTGECAGKEDNQRCLLANMVTDVIVQGADNFGHQGGRVLAVVGYRAGNRPFPQNPSVGESPWNGLYRSDNGLPGTFTWLQNPSGFAPQNRIGNTKLGATIGPDQNHNYVYAIVQDAGQFRGDPPLIDLPSAISSQTGPLPSESVLLGVYVSSDFGDTWTQMANHQEIADNPTTGSALAGAGQAQLYAPGVQAWYNEWIHPDPTRQDPNGVPERLTFGLEEVWQNTLTTVAQNGHSNFKVIGKYFSGKTCLFMFTPTNICPTSTAPQQGSTTHPDQHAGLYIPDRNGGVTLMVGNDGGAYSQHAASGAEFNNESWGSGINEGFNTLLPYHARVAKDGVVWYGLQDNGTGKVQTDGTYVETMGGDGTFVAVDPNNSDYAWEATPGGAMASTTDGGKTWSPQPPPITNAQFVNPYVMDPRDSNHLLTAGTEVVETTMGPKTCVSVTDPTGNVQEAPSQTCNWVTVYNLGTLKHPGDSSVPGSTGQGADDPSNQQSALDLLGDNAYVAYCGPCDIMNTNVGFHSGIATNVDGSLPPQKGTPNGWHIASAYGLANRTITGVAIDPTNPETVYVTVGGYARGWRGPHSYGDHNSKLMDGTNVYKSTNAGATFHNISAGLPNVPANTITIRGSQLIVGTDIGVFISNDKNGSEWAPLGKGLPHVPVSSLQVQPGNSNVLIASTYGRSIWIYHFAGSSHRAGFAWPAGAEPMIGTFAALLLAVLVSRRRMHVPLPA